MSLLGTVKLLNYICLSLNNNYMNCIQVISDRVVRNLMESSINLKVLCLHYCLGSLTSFSFQTKAPALRILRLQWVTPWMTNDDLIILTQNCNLVELSLSGCKLLDSSKFTFMFSNVDPFLFLLTLSFSLINRLSRDNLVWVAKLDVFTP